MILIKMLLIETHLRNAISFYSKGGWESYLLKEG